MRLSFITDELGLDLAEALPILQSWGLKYVSLRGRLLGKTLDTLSASELAEVKQLVDAHGLTVACLESFLAHEHLADATLRQADGPRLDAVLRAADALGCRLVRSSFYWRPQGEERGTLADRPDRLGQAVDAFAPLAERAKKAGLVLAFENCNANTDDVLAFCDAVGEPSWGLAWDVANEWFQNPRRSADEKAYVARLAPRTRAVHAKAAGLVKGLGNPIPWRRILQTLDNIGLAGPVSVETKNPDRPATCDVDQGRRAYDALKKAWPAAAPGMSEECAVDLTGIVREYKPVGYVVVGLGMGYNRAKTLTETPGNRLVGVVDRDEDRAQKCSDEFGVPWTTSLQPWLENPDADAVYILTPTGLHAPIALEALAAGKHVLLTKPMEASVAACDRMIRLAEEKGLQIGVDFEVRFNPEALAVRQAVREGRLGRILSGEVSLKIQRTMEYYKTGGGWRGTRALDGGGVLSNQCIHHIDQAVFALGVPARIKCEVRTQAHPIEVEDLACALWEYADGSLLTLYATTCYPHQTWYYRMEIHGTDGAVSLARGGPLDKPQARWFLGGAWSDKGPEAKPEWLNAADNFAAAIRTGAPQVCDGRDARRTQAVLETMYLSAYGTRDWVDVQAELPTP